jgi:hypothetical protein
MCSTSVIKLCDLSRRRKFETNLSGELSPMHTVEQALERYFEATDTPPNGGRWHVSSRGVGLDLKSRLSELAEEDNEWMVIPEVSAGAA